MTLAISGGAVAIALTQHDDGRGGSTALWAVPASTDDAAPATPAPDRSMDRADRGEYRTEAQPAVTQPQPAASEPVSAPPSTRQTSAPGRSGSCEASFYAKGAKTASGEAFKPDGLTAAHKTLPFNTRVKVTNLGNGSSVVVRINDRGPFVAGRCIDLAKGAFESIASIHAGVINVRYEVLS